MKQLIYDEEGEGWSFHMVVGLGIERTAQSVWEDTAVASIRVLLRMAKVFMMRRGGFELLGKFAQSDTCRMLMS